MKNYLFTAHFKMRLPYTLNIQTGRKLNDTSKEEIMKEVVKVFDSLDVVAVQVAFKVVSDDGFRTAMANSGVRLFGCNQNTRSAHSSLPMARHGDYKRTGYLCDTESVVRQQTIRRDSNCRTAKDRGNGRGSVSGSHQSDTTTHTWMISSRA